MATIVPGEVNDFDWDSRFGDLDPVAAAKIKRRIGIAPDYFTHVPDDPTAEQLRLIRRELLALVDK